VANDHEANNEGYAADEVSAFVDEATHRIALQVVLAVRDSDGHLFRVSYQVTVLGYIQRGTLPGPLSTGGVLG
jgi:6-phosphofructokinase